MRSILNQPEMKDVLKKLNHLQLIDPVGYLDMINLEKYSDKIITDSGGMQKEAFFLKRPCITIRDESEWVETVDAGYNVVVGADTKLIVEAIRNFNPDHEVVNPYGDGHSADLIAKNIYKYLEKV